MKNEKRIALAGNPNVGKTSLFNRITGQRAKVGNFPGITVEMASAELNLPGEQEPVQLIDLPGTYSLAAVSLDEQVVVDVLAGHHESVPRPDLIVYVADAANLHRNMFLASQIAEMEIPMVILLNQWDVAKRLELEIDIPLLEERLGVPVVPLVARTGEGVEKVLEVVAEALESPRCMKRIEWPEAVKGALACLRERAAEFGVDSWKEAEVQRLAFDARSPLLKKVGWSEDEGRDAVGEAREAIRAAGFNPLSSESVLQHRHIGDMLQAAVCYPERRRVRRSESIDRLVTHPVWGMLIFVGLMWLVFQSVYSWAGPLMDLIDEATGMVQEGVAPSLETMPVLQSLIVDGVIAGVGGVVIFLPQIMILFLFVGLLEETGYMGRAAYLMDRTFQWCGLSGRSFVPMLSSYACAIPGLMATRTIADRKARLTTILIAPLMSCSARLPVYVIMIGAFVEPHYGAGVAGLVLLAMHFVGLLVALPVAYVINRMILKGKPQPFMLEMVSYRVPRMKAVLLGMLEKGWDFVKNAGTVIFAFSIIIWALLYFPRNEEVARQVEQEFAQEAGISENQLEDYLSSHEEAAASLENRIEGAYIENSYMGRLGKAVQPVFAPAGFDWRITVGVLASFPAREIIVATLGVIYNLGGDVDEESGDLRDAMARSTWQQGPLAGQPVFTIPVALAIMVFFALCMQCGATVAVMAREAGWKYAVIGFTYMTALAWVLAVLVYQVGTAIMGGVA